MWDTVGEPTMGDEDAERRGTIDNMSEKHNHLEKVDAKERAKDFREAILSADATGMIAGEERITESETILPTLPQRSAPPDKQR